MYCTELASKVHTPISLLSLGFCHPLWLGCCVASLGGAMVATFEFDHQATKHLLSVGRILVFALSVDFLEIDLLQNQYDPACVQESTTA